jgi:ParB family transcriptional regulator, chromosome partitioning protein
MSKIKNTGLGKGLGALLPSVEFSKEKGLTFRHDEDESLKEGNIAQIDISKIRQNPYQPRREFDENSLQDLKNSILEHGIIQPITVRRAVEGYELISGERRLRAAIAAGYMKLPAYILEIVEDIQMLELALIENLQRENLNPIEIANGYQRLLEECSLTQEQVAEKVSKDRTTVTNFLRLLRLPEKIQESLRNKEISVGHARALLALSGQKNILLAGEYVITNGLSVRATETLVKDIESGKLILDPDLKKPLINKPKKRNPYENVSPDTVVILEDSERRLRHIFGTKVKINPKNEDSGSIEFDFFTKDEFGRLLDLFTIIESESSD